MKLQQFGGPGAALGSEPSVMPVDAKVWGQQLSLSNFTNSYYQFKDIQSLTNPRSILIVGPGQGLDTAVLRWRGYKITTLDIDSTFNPDVVGSVHDLRVFDSKQFDVVIASHVIEHLPPAYLDMALRELARVAHFALIYVPTAGRPVELSFSPGVRGTRFSIVINLYNWFRRPNPKKALFCAGQHYWEVGRPGYSRRQLAKRVSSHFEILRQYRNRDWLFSFNYVLRSKATENP
jgi:SAM-dependent methyltransferase